MPKKNNKQKKSAVKAVVKQPQRKAEKPRDYSVLVLDKYIPDALVARDTQIKEIQKWIDAFIKTGYGKSLVLEGPTGAGKTASIRYALQNIDPKHYTYITCKGNNEVRGILADVGSVTMVQRDTKKSIMDKVKASLQQNKKLVILDDITVTPIFPELVDCLNEVYRDTPVPFFLTTNYNNFLTKIPGDAKSTFNFIIVNFNKYKAPEIENIIKGRLKAVGEKLPEATIKYIAALAAQEGSARTALDLVYEALTTKLITEKDIQTAFNKRKEQSYNDSLANLQPTEKRVLNSILNRYATTKRASTYEDIQGECSLSQPRVTQVIQELEKSGRVTTYKERGRKICSPEPLLVKLYQENQEKVNDLLR